MLAANHRLVGTNHRLLPANYRLVRANEKIIVKKTTQMRHWSASNGDWLCAASRTAKKSRPPLDVREKACGESEFAAFPLADVGCAKER